jgi:polyhydroxybutyrate depolymerase
MERLTGIVPVATGYGFAVVLPNAADGRGYWDDGRFGDVDDIGFVAHTVEHASGCLSSEISHVFLLGFSSGATMALLAAATLEFVSGVGAVAGTIGRTFARRAEPAPPTPLIYFHGTHDPFAYYHTGGSAGTRRGSSLSVPELGTFWAERNRCNLDGQIDELPTVGDDGTRVERTTYRGPSPECEVVLHTILGGGHTWPGGRSWASDRLVGRTSRQIDATELACQFFLSHCSANTGVGDERHR